MRKTFSQKDRARIFASHNGLCGLSGEKIGPGDDWHIEHRVPVALGGTNDDENLYPALVDPHKQKTRDDVKRISKAKRQGNETGQQARRAKRDRPLIPSRPFAKSANKKAWPKRSFEKRKPE